MSSQVIHEYTRSTGEVVVFTLVPPRFVQVYIDNEFVEERYISRTWGLLETSALRFARNWQDSDGTVRS